MTVPAVPVGLSQTRFFEALGVPALKDAIEGVFVRLAFDAAVS